MKSILILLILCVPSNFTGKIQTVFKTENYHSQPAKITIFSTRTQTLFQIQSEFGIGNAIISLLEGSWPRNAILRLYLEGLEGISISGSGHKFEKSQLLIYQNNTPDQKYYDITLPNELFSEGYDLQISWVDFYRN